MPAINNEILKKLRFSSGLVNHLGSPDRMSCKKNYNFVFTAFFYFSLAAILVGSRDHRTQFWKRAIQGPFHQSVVAIGPVVSEEKIQM